MRSKFAAAVTAAVMAVPAAAQAHVTIQPDSATAGGFTVESVRVPNERDDASTTKVDVQLPDGFAFVSYQTVPGWKVKVTREHLSTPIELFGEKVEEQVKQVTFTATGKGIGPGQFQDFPLSVQIPGKAGDKLTFKAVQTYSNGDVVRWIGTADSDHPAPRLTVAAASAGSGSAAPAPPAAPARPADGGGSDTIGVIALIVGGIGLVAAAAALVITRRPRPGGTAQAA